MRIFESLIYFLLWIILQFYFCCCLRSSSFSSQALTMSPIVGRRESLGFFMGSCTNGGENLFSAKCPGGHGPQIFRLPCPALSCIPLGPAFYFLAKFCHLATEKTERACDLSTEDFLGKKNIKNFATFLGKKCWVRHI